ncbi:hypothetical protein TNCV_363371 [Trichonephila clavipes]|nr:hypothetical protein TNCV_363371 [Trichonephila clavipes]
MWKWGSEQEAFRELKSKLASPPVLKPADSTKPFVIRTDANSVAWPSRGEKDGEKEEESEQQEKVNKTAERENMSE